MTERLYYRDAYLREFKAQVLDVKDTVAYLDRSAFYPSSGGQPFDLGWLGDARVIDVIDEDERVGHKLDKPVGLGDIEATIDWPRRFDHMQQHTGQHLLSAVIEDLFGIKTVSFHLGQDSATIDVVASTLDAKQVERMEDRVNEVVFENRPVTVTFEESPKGLRKASERTGILRVVSIEGLDRSACGGTHVRATGEIGAILIRKLDKAHGNTRIEFLCGGRAVRRARTDFDAISRIALCLSSPLDETPALVRAQTDRLQEADKLRRRLAGELSQLQGRDLYQSAAPDAGGFRRVVERGSLSEETRLKAQAFAAGSKAVFVALSEQPPSILFAVSADSGIHAGDVLKAALSKAGGRGGGNSAVAQGTAPTADTLEEVLRNLP